MVYKESFLNYLQYEKRYSQHTVVSYECDLTQFYHFCDSEMGQFNIQEFTHRDIRRWIVSLLQEGNSPRTVNRKLSTLKSFFRYLQRESFVEGNPMDKVIAPRQGKKLPSFVSEHSMQLLQEVDFGEGFVGTRDRLILELFYTTGMRLSELMGLTLGSFDHSADTLKVLGKWNKERILPMNDGVRALLESYLRERESCFGGKEQCLFLTRKGAPVYEKLLYRIVRKFLGKVTTQTKRSPHVLRHTFATHLLNNGADLNAVKELLGHANLSATQIYTHTTFEKLKGVYELAHPRA